MQFLKCLLFVVPFFCVSAFASVEGLFHVETPFSYTKGSKTLTVPAGDYKADLKTRSSSMTLKFKDQAGEKHKVKMSVPRNSMPSRNGTFHYESTQVEQPFDLSGQIATQEERRPTQSRYETCTYQRPIQVCTIDPTGRRICRLEYQTVQGHHQVLFHYLISTSATLVTLEGATDRSLLGNFSGTQTVQYIVNEYTGPCQ
ncbi:MAG: hypothetical protein A2X86_08575 [Bdellovibrionales bacterium GWA2_49_15]|nr:MAG: hypothetical protein A2X86_08575 [Bdellovibrionales bacterium GWA2_49_15]HAZ11183.1 hypothetical protein [Bdellovibrionales bacterium]